MMDNDILLIKDLEELVDKKNILLKKLNNSYYNLLGYLKKKEYDVFIKKLDNQQKIVDKLYNIDDDISNIVEKCKNYNGEILQLLKGKMFDNTFPSCLKELSESISTSQVLAGKCKDLNKELILRTKEAQKEIRQNLISIKKQRLINSGYKLQNSSKTGLFIDYKK